MSAHKSVEAAIGAEANATADGPLLLAAQNGGNPVVQRLAAASASVNSWDALEEMLLAADGRVRGTPPPSVEQGVRGAYPVLPPLAVVLRVHPRSPHLNPCFDCV